MTRHLRLYCQSEGEFESIKTIKFGPTNIAADTKARILRFNYWGKQEMEWINILWVMLGIGLMLVLNIRYQINSMVALLLAALLVGTLAGMDLLKLLHTIKAGFGGTLGELAIIVVFGAVIGKLMVDSGAAHQIAQTLLRRFGLKYVEAAVIIIGLIFGLAMFYEVAFIIWHTGHCYCGRSQDTVPQTGDPGSCCSDDGSLPIPTTAGAGCAGCRLWRRHGDGLYLWSSGCYSFSDLCRAYFAKVLGQSGAANSDVPEV